MAKQYKVTAPYITVTVASGDGQARLTGFYRDHVLPPEVPESQIKDHLEAGLIAEIPGSEQAKVPEPTKEALAATKAADDALTQAQRERDGKGAPAIVEIVPTKTTGFVDPTVKRAAAERDHTAGGPTGPGGDPYAGVPAKGSKPERSAPKSEWVAYAVARTAGTPGALTDAEADALSKAELVERFK